MLVIEEIIKKLPEFKGAHVREGAVYNLFREKARKEIERLFSSQQPTEVDFLPFGKLVFPYHKMGAIDSLNLFDLDELIIFSFYWQNRQRYKKVADIGANIGLHSILLSKCGYVVHSYEPDPETFKVLQRNLLLNQSTNVTPFNAAVSSKLGEMEFVRVCGNTTGSHLAGSKANPYGDLDRFLVKVEGIKAIIDWADLIKLDAEGHEKEILLATNREQWLRTDAIVEVENKENAAVLFNYFKDLGINLFAQKINWRKVEKIADMPAGYKHGSLFVTAKTEMPW